MEKQAANRMSFYTVDENCMWILEDRKVNDLLTAQKIQKIEDVGTKQRHLPLCIYKRTFISMYFMRPYESRVTQQSLGWAAQLDEQLHKAVGFSAICRKQVFRWQLLDYVDGLHAS